MANTRASKPNLRSSKRDLRLRLDFDALIVFTNELRSEKNALIFYTNALSSCKDALRFLSNALTSDENALRFDFNELILFTNALSSDINALHFIDFQRLTAKWVNFPDSVGDGLAPSR